MLVRKKIIPPLFPHQEDAVKRMIWWERTPYMGIVGGMIALKMGLGKTRTCLELVGRTKGDCNTTHTAPTLVVCKKSNIHIWVADIERFYRKSLSYFVFYSSYCDTSQVTFHELSKYDVVITTYETVRSHFTDAEPQCFKLIRNNFMGEEPGLYCWSDIPETWKIANIHKPDPAKCKNESIIYSHRWRRIISDESQNFVNTKCKLYQAMVALVADFYFCLSGTPIVNYTTDLYSVFRFMGLVAKRQDWNLELYTTLRLKKRVLMKDYEDTTIRLPEIQIVNEFITLNPMEKEMYATTVLLLKKKIKEFKQGDSTFAAPLALFIRLRQICCCPNIIMRPKIDVQAHIKKLERILEVVENNENVDFSFIGETLLPSVPPPEDTTELQNAETLEYLISGKHILTKDQIDQYFPISIHANVDADEEAECAVCVDVYAQNQKIRTLTCGHKFHADCIDEWLMTTFASCPLCRKIFNPEELSQEDLFLYELSFMMDPTDIKTRLADEIYRLKHPAFFGVPHLDDYARKNRTSGKIEKIVELVKANPNSKFLIFSTFVQFLKIVIERLDEAGEKSLLLYGETKSQDRQDMIEYFAQPDAPRVFISSFKCGGVGLNMTAADKVIICEPWWNAATEEQAIARAHRVGQTKPVTVYNLIIHPSFEAYLLQVQEQKRKIMHNFLGKKDNRYSRMDNITAQDIIEWIINSGGKNYETHTDNLL